MRKILRLILKILAKRVIARYRPIVVGITGSVGKTMAKEAIYAVLSRRFWVRKNEENFNNEIGVPMAVLGLSPKQPNYKLQNFVQGSVLGITNYKKKLESKFQIINYKLKWIIWIFKSVWLAYGPFKTGYPEVLVLELAADKPRDIEYLVDIVKPKIGVITAVGEVPVHVEFYASPLEVAKEKARLIEGLEPGGLAILNYDDQTVLEMKEKSRAKIATFGFSNKADFWASDINYFVVEDHHSVEDFKSIIGGFSLKINYAGTFIPVKTNNLIGVHQLYGILSAVAAGQYFGINFIISAGALENLEPPKGRMNLLRGVKKSILIDDTYNASPLSTHAALDTLQSFSKALDKLGHKSRKIAVLGDMKELGKYEIEAHRAIGNIAAERCDILVTVGAAAKFIADSASNQLRHPQERVGALTGASGMSKENIFSFNTSEEAALKVQEIMKEGDVVLVKGSRSMKMERVVEEIKEAL